MMKRPRKRYLPAVMASVAILAGLTLLKLAHHDAAAVGKSIFSWSEHELENPDSVFAVMAAGDIDTIFQYITPDDSPETIVKFLDGAAQNDKAVYFLSGEPEWALDKEATQVIKAIEQIAYYRSRGNYQSTLKGVVVDIEPYSLSEFKADPEAVMAAYVTSMMTAYQAARAHDVAVILCLPYYFDTLGFSTEVESLARDAADALAIMNYYRGKEAEHLKTEAQMSLKYGKPIVNIYELQPPGVHGLVAENTYYHEGLEAVYANFKQLKRAFPHQEIYLSLHEFKSFQALSGME